MTTMTATRRALVGVLLGLVGLFGALAYLRDPAWLIRTESGFRPWETTADGTRYRWTGGHASFFVRSDASEVSIPVRTTFSSPSDGAVTVTFSIDDRPTQRFRLIDDTAYLVTLSLPPRGSRRVRRIDIRVDRTRPGNRGVEVGEVSITHH
jgi:hypothetical protein